MFQKYFTNMKNWSMKENVKNINMYKWSNKPLYKSICNMINN